MAKNTRSKAKIIEVEDSETATMSDVTGAQRGETPTNTWSAGTETSIMTSSGTNESLGTTGGVPAPSAVGRERIELGTVNASVAEPAGVATPSTDRSRRREVKKRILELQLALLEAQEEDDCDLSDDGGETIINRTLRPKSILMPQDNRAEGCGRGRGSTSQDYDIPQAAANENTSQHLATALVEAMKLLNKQQQSPPAGPPKYLRELPTFNGCATEWIPFKTVFNDTRNMFSDIQNVGRLRMALKGEARDSVKGMLYASSCSADIMDALERRFGRPEVLIMHELDTIKKMPRLQEDGSNIHQFASTVNNCVATIQALGRPQYLYSPELTSKIVDKLNLYMRYEWSKFCMQYPSEPELQRMSRFLKDASEQLCSITALNFSKEGGRGGAGGRADRRRHVNTAQAVESADSSDQDSDCEENSDEEVARGTVAAVAPKQKPEGPVCPICQTTHALKDCEKFKLLDTEKRWETTKKHNICFRCLTYKHRRFVCRAKACGKNGCKLGHHKLLHQEKREPEAREETATQLPSVNAINSKSKTYLKIIPIELYGPRGSTDAYALLDEGSTLTLIEENTALAVTPRGKTESLQLEGVGGKRIDCDGSFRVKIKVKGRFQRHYETLTAHTISQLNVMAQEVNADAIKSYPYLADIEDELCYDRARPTVLIGQDNWHLIVTRELRSRSEREPAASLTSLGWVLHGKAHGIPRSLAGTINHVTLHSDEDKIERSLKEHFSLESLGIEPRRPKSDPEARALDILDKTCSRLPDGRMQVGLLWRTDNETMPESRDQAVKRFINLEKKLDKDENMKTEYSQQVNNLVEKGYAEKVNTPPDSPRAWYLPHFAVRHPQKNKVRMVFDAAARTGGRCLNDALLPGPDLLQSLFGVLLRFREGKVAVMADIKEMFLQVKLQPQDRDSQRFLWRPNKQSPIEEYRMTTLIFGAASSPCSAIYAKNTNAQQYKDKYPDASRAVERHFYMDDYLQAFDDVQTAKQAVSQMTEIHNAAHFELRGWASNEPKVIERPDSESNIKTLADREERTLGLIWNMNADSLSFSLNLRNTPLETIQGHRPPTKREVTSAVMSVFDPLGLAAPIIIQGKHLIQQLWRTKTGWDDEIPKIQEDMWKRWLEELKQLDNLGIPRNIKPHPSHKGEGPRPRPPNQLHCFCDASETAYAAAVYLLSEEPRTVRLLAAKTRVAPLKPISIPRLELQAAVLGCRLTHTIKKELDTPTNSTTYWTDSRTVLAWIQSDPRAYKPFVAHRLAEIEDYSKQNEWRWVPTKDNVADDATREAPANFNSHHRWFTGPSFLYQPASEWPSPPASEHIDLSDEEKRKTSHVLTITRKNDSLPDSNRFSSYQRFIRATARVLWCIDRFRSRVSAQDGILPRHLHNAEIIQLQRAQRDSFANEVKCLKTHSPFPRASRLRKICLQLDENDVMRATGRLDRYYTADETRRPIMLDASHPFTKLIIQRYHEMCFHGNHETVMNELRQKYYILGLRNTVRTITHQCQWCRLKRGQPSRPDEGGLPLERLDANTTPFNCTAIDYFGPITITIGRRTEKRWGVLLTCLTTRAIHLELAASLKPSSAILALRRFFARRGAPTIIYSDNGTNFVRANKEITNELQKYAGSRKIVWKFIPPGAPHMGGAWERMIKTVKNSLYATLREKSPKEETLSTLLTEIEHVVNSRPLTPVQPDLHKEALTPNHFLIGRSCGTVPMGNFDTTEADAKSWRLSQQLANEFWRRWTREYLPQLLPRQPTTSAHHQEPKIGDVVLIVDGLLPRGMWPRGEIENILPGRDNKVRITEVRTKHGILRRPTSRLITLTSRDTVFAHKGEDVGNLG